MWQVDRKLVLPLLDSTHRFVQELFEWAVDHHAPGAKKSQLKKLAKIARDPTTSLGRLASVPNSDLSGHMANLAGSEYLVALKAEYDRITANYQLFFEQGAVVQLSDAQRAGVDKLFRYLYESLLNQGQFWKEYPSSDPTVVNKNTLREKLGAVTGACPYCDLIPVAKPEQSTIDHMLGQSHFPVLSIYGPNLVLSCYTCNLPVKRDAFIGTQNRTASNVPLFHPLFHQAADHVRFMFKSDFTPVGPQIDTLDPLQAKRVRNYLKLFRLRSIYEAEQAAMFIEVQGFVPLVRAAYRLRAIKEPPGGLKTLQAVLWDVASDARMRREAGKGVVTKTKLTCDLYSFLATHLDYFAKDLKLIS